VRKDSPINMILSYQEQISGLIELQEQLVEFEAYNLRKIFNLAWPHLNNIISELVGGCIIGILDQNLNNYVFKNKNGILKEWEKVDSHSINLILTALSQHNDRSAILWTYKEDSPKLTIDSPKKQVIALSWLCQKVDDESLYMMLIRNTERRPFLSHEVQAIELTSRIMGSCAKFTNTYEALLGSISKTWKSRSNYL